MNRLKILLVALLIVVLVETSVILAPYLPGEGPASSSLVEGPSQSFSYSYQVFNQPISNDTDARLQPSYNSSWEALIQSSLGAASPSSDSESQLALAPNYRSENLSIPTIVVQERADGLLRIEYYAQNWNNTFGLVLYNSTSPTWVGGENVTLKFISFAPPSEVNPQIAPRPNGNLTITIGKTVVLSDYPIAWASMAHIYLYGLRGSSFTEGTVRITFRGLGGG